MPLIVETGVGVPDADSWVSMADSNAYATKVGNTAWVDGDAELKEPALRRAAQYIIAVYGNRFPGKRTQAPELQSLPWPRSNVADDDGYLIADDLVPTNLKWAQIEAAFLELARAGTLQPTATSRLQKSVTVGPLSVTYEDSVGNKYGPTGQPLFSIIDGLMQPLLDLNKTSSVAFLKRA